MTCAGLDWRDILHAACGASVRIRTEKRTSVWGLAVRIGRGKAGCRPSSPAQTPHQVALVDEFGSEVTSFDGGFVSVLAENRSLASVLGEAVQVRLWYMQRARRLTCPVHQTVARGRVSFKTLGVLGQPGTQVIWPAFMASDQRALGVQAKLTFFATLPRTASLSSRVPVITTPDNQPLVVALRSCAPGEIVVPQSVGAICTVCVGRPSPMIASIHGAMLLLGTSVRSEPVLRSRRRSLRVLLMPSGCCLRRNESGVDCRRRVDVSGDAAQIRFSGCARSHGHRRTRRAPTAALCLDHAPAGAVCQRRTVRVRVPHRDRTS